jgi:hypothetical protein
MKEIELKAEKTYQNCYTDVDCWVELKGPGFSKRVYGFWDGENNFKIRVAAVHPGEWGWESSSNQPDDDGLNNHSGQFTAVEWTEEEKEQNPNRRGFPPNSNGHHYSMRWNAFFYGWRHGLPELPGAFLLETHRRQKTMSPDRGWVLKMR